MKALFGELPHMYGSFQFSPSRQPQTSNTAGPKLIGYILSSKNFEPGREAIFRLQDMCHNNRSSLHAHETEVGMSTNPFRSGLWRALRRLVCNTCEPKRMPLSMLNFEDFCHQALSPCHCGNPAGLDGIVVTKMDHLTCDRQKGAALIIKLARLKKHVIAEDGICLSCCHPATKAIVNGAS